MFQVRGEQVEDEAQGRVVDVSVVRTATHGGRALQGNSVVALEARAAWEERVNDKKWKEDRVPEHMRMDVHRRNQNIDDGATLCKRCNGTGNELYSMYRACADCGGSGVAQEVKR